MRKCGVFASIPGKPFFKEMYFEAIKPISAGNLDVFSFFDRPPVGEFSKEIHIHIAYSNIVLAVASTLDPTLIRSGSKRSSKIPNPNVLYEVGLAVGNGKPIIPITDDPSKLPAMIRHVGAVVYNPKAPDWKKLTNDLEERCAKILTGEYMELRRRTHIELLVRQGHGNKKPKSSKKSKGSKKQGPSNDILGDAIAAYKQEDHERVIRLLGPMIEQGFDHEAAYFFLSDAYFLSGESMPEGEKKYTYYRKQLEVAVKGHYLFDHHQDIHKNLGLAHLKLRDLSKAQAIFEEITQRHPNYHIARYNLACVYAQRGDLFPCITQLSHIIEKDSSWRNLARVDPDFDPLWQNDVFQRLLFPVTSLK